MQTSFFTTGKFGNRRILRLVIKQKEAQKLRGRNGSAIRQREIFRYIFNKINDALIFLVNQTFLRKITEFYSFTGFYGTRIKRFQTLYNI